MRGIPAGALWLGLLGLLPFYGAALLAHQPLTVGAAARIGFVVYAAVILSFLGGVRWGLEIARESGTPSPRRLVLSVLPPLYGWACAVGTLVWDLSLSGFVATGFVLQFLWDRAAAREGLAPAWYEPLRSILTVGVLGACFLLIVLERLERVATT